MVTARKLMICEEEATYHCVSRCVRRAHLCGFDRYSGKNFDHRKEWVRQRLIFLSQIFSVDVLGYALMGNHQHTLIRTRPDLLKRISDEEVAVRWLRLYYPMNGGKDNLQMPSALEIFSLCINKTRIRELRERLGSISWFMKSLNEYIAVRANAEDKCTGRFWEGRFKSVRLFGEGAALSCSIYIDLNVIRAGLAKTPETSVFTSAWERIKACKAKSDFINEPNLWLSPIHDNENQRGFLSIELLEYLQILDTTGRALKLGKRGKIPDELNPILSRLGVDPKRWLHTVKHLGTSFSIAAGNEKSLTDCASRVGKKWLKGITVARRTFL